MKVTQEFLREIQRAGWIIEHVDADVAVAQCPMQGCGMRAKLRPGATVPQACPGTGKLADVHVADYAQLLAFLSQRRENLALNMPQADEIIGLADGHIGKLESMARQPWPATLFDWVAGLGYQIVLRPVGLPPKALAVIAQSRARAAVKRRQYAAKRQLR